MAQSTNLKLTKVKRFFKVDGSTWKPIQYHKAAVNLALGPQEIVSPGDIVREPKALERLQASHANKRFLIRSLAMGNPLAKVGLTDLSARVMLETQFDTLVYKSCGRYGAELVLAPPVHIKGRGLVRRTQRISLSSLFEYLKLYYQLLPENRYAARNLVKLTGIDPDYPTQPRLIGPVLAMFNGDDNFRLNEAWATFVACKNTEKRGQVIELSKVSSSRLYICYCQAMGFNPIARLVDIVLARMDALKDEAEQRWTYDPGQTTFVCLEGLRNKLLSQAAKGGRDRNILEADTSVTGRSALLSKELSYQPAERRLLAHFLHRLSYPQWYTNLTVAQRLPAALGGLDAQDFTKIDDVWTSLVPEHKQMISALTGSDPILAILAGRVLNRARTSNQDIDIDSEEKRSEKGREIVELWNTLHPLRQVKILTWGEVTGHAVEILSARSQKSVSLLSGSGVGVQWTPKAIQSIVRSEYVRLDWFDSSFLHVPFICQVLDGKAKLPTLPDPIRAHERTLRRIQRSKLLKEQPDAPALRPDGETPYHWLRAATQAKQGRLFISQSDFEMISPPRKFNLRLLPMALAGSHDPEIIRNQDNYYGHDNYVVRKQRSTTVLATVPDLSKPLEETFGRLQPEESELTSVVDEINDDLEST